MLQFLPMIAAAAAKAGSAVAAGAAKAGSALASGASKAASLAGSAGGGGAPANLIQRLTGGIKSAAGGMGNGAGKMMFGPETMNSASPQLQEWMRRQAFQRMGQAISGQQPQQGQGQGQADAPPLAERPMMPSPVPGQPPTYAQPMASGGRQPLPGVQWQQPTPKRYGPY